MTYLEIPSEYGFPNVVRLPLGITREPVADSTFYHSIPLPQWIDSEAIPPGAISDPKQVERETMKVLRAIAKAAALFGPF